MAWGCASRLQRRTARTMSCAPLKFARTIRSRSRDIALPKMLTKRVRALRMRVRALRMRARAPLRLPSD
eukprot:1055000-Prymnesium_polylepis.1